MAKTNNSSNKLPHLDLSIQLGLSGLSFCILNTASKTIVSLNEFHFEKQLNPLKVLDELKTIFTNEALLNNDFSNVTIIHDNELSTLVPKSLFNKNHLADYLKFNAKILKSDFIAYDVIAENNSVNVYVPYININNFIYDKFGTFTFKHVTSVLIESILKMEVDSVSTKVYVNVSFDHFEILVLEKNKLLLSNNFTYNSKEDFIYYLLFTAEQLNLDPETLNLILIGAIHEHDELYNIIYKYIRNVSLGTIKYDFEYVDKPKANYSNFTLLKSF